MFKNSRKDYKLPLWPLAPPEDVNRLPSLDADKETAGSHGCPPADTTGSQDTVSTNREAITGSHTQDFSTLKIFGPQNCFHGYGGKGIQRQNNLIRHAYIFSYAYVVERMLRKSVFP